MIVVTVARRPLSTGSVASNVLEHGCGALNIDVCRISTSDSLNGGAYTEGRTPRVMNPGGAGDRKVADCGSFNQPTGRWPANLILQHLNGCRQDGTRKVKAIAPMGTPCRGSKNTGVFSAGTLRIGSGYGNKDGTETVLAWDCGPGCPVAELDEQSGDRPVSGTAWSGRMHKQTSGGMFHGGSKGSQAILPADKGGASRFFKQVGGSR